MIVVTALELSDQFIIGKDVDSFVSDNARIITIWMSIYFGAFVFETILSRIQTMYEIKNFNFELGHHISNVSLGQIKREHSGKPFGICLEIKQVS